MVPAIIRLILGVALLAMVWREAGVWTALAITLLAVNDEVTAVVFDWHGDMMREDRKTK